MTETMLHPIQTMHWSQPNPFKMKFELWDGEHLAGKVRFPSVFRLRGVAESDSESWNFDTKGLARPEVTIHPQNSEAVAGTFAHNRWMTGGSLKLANGNRIEVQTNVWKRSITFSFKDGPELFKAQYRSRISLKADLEIYPAGAAAVDQYPWLTTFALYLAGLWTNHYLSF